MLRCSKEYPMSQFMNWFRQFSRAGRSHGHKPKRRQRPRPAIEALEDRAVPSVNPSGDLAQIPFVAPSGPTTLALNFDGENFYSQGGFLGIGANSINVGSYSVNGSLAQTDQNMQDILFRVSEIYAPFNVQVTRLHGGNTYLSNNGNSTVFVGPSGDTGAGTTPDEFVDYPISSLFSVPRHAEAYHLAFVDPFQNNKGAIPDVATAIAHEAGHTFGLAHVRTDGLSDPAPLASGTIPEVMSYNRFSGLEYFKDQSLTLTAWNQSSSGLQLSSSLPAYLNFRPTTQDSFYSLGQVLGYRSDSIDNHFHVADSGAIDSQYQNQYVHPSSDDMNAADSSIPEQGTITRIGDYDVYRWTAPASETINVKLLGQNGLSPSLLVYDNTGQLVYVQDGIGRPGQLQNGSASTGTLNVTANTAYYFVVGAQDSDSTGSYQFTINQLPGWAQLSGGNLSINGNQLGANATETLTINTDAQGRILATLNGQMAQLEPSQVSSITVNSLGGNNTINVERLPASVSLALNLSNADTVNFSPTGENLDQIQGRVSINGNPVSLAVTLFDQHGAGSRTYGMASKSLSLPDGDTVAVSAPVSSIILDTASSANVVNVDATPAAVVTINDPAANSVVNVSPVSQNLGGINILNIEGSGSTTVTVNDQANPGAKGLFLSPSTTYIVNGTSLTRSVFSPFMLRPSTSTIDYYGLATLTLNAGNNGPNTVNVESTAVPTYVNAGAATGQINVAPTLENLDYIAGALTVTGGGPLSVYDQNSLHAAAYTAGSGVTRGHAAINGFGVQSLALYTSKAAPNQVTVNALPEPIAVNSGAADAITVTAFSVPILNSLSGTQTVTNQLTVNAHGGTLTVDERGGLQNDPLDTFSDAFTVTDQAVVLQKHWHKVLKPIIDPEIIRPKNSPPPGTIVDTTFIDTLSYTNVASLTIDGGPISSSFNVQSTVAGVPVTINTSPGANQFIVGGNGSVKNIRSQLTLHGSGPNNTLLVDDSQATTQDKVTVTPTQVGAAAADQFFAAGGSLTYGGMASLTLNLSHAADDTVQLTPSAATAFVVNGDPAEFLAGHGAGLNVDLTGVLDALLTPGGPGAGKLTFTKGSHQPVTFKNMGAVHTH
jgi:hypothetical protein